MIFAIGYQTVLDLATDSFAVGQGVGSGLTAKTAVEVRTLLSVYTAAQVDAGISAAVVGLWDFKGSTDASSNPNYPAASKGDTYYVSVAGKIGGASGKSVDVGDSYIASADNAGGAEASVGVSWFVLEHNLAGALLSANNLSDLASAATARTNLGLGTLATQSGTFSGTSSGTNTGDQLLGDGTLAAAVDYSGGVNNENLLSAMPSSTDILGRNKINTAGLTAVTVCTNLGAAADGAANRIASVAKPNSGGTGGGPALFDTNFVDDVLSGDPVIGVVSIFGAYDQVCNSTGSSCVASPHSFVKHSTGGHNNIVGGSTLLISGTSLRCVQLAGLYTIIHDGNFSTAINCKQTTLNGTTFTTAVGCSLETVITSSHSLHVGAAGKTLSGTKALTVGDVTSSGSYCAAAGANVTVTGSYGLTVGSNLTNAVNGAAVFGYDAVALQPDSINLGGIKISTKGDVALCIPVDGVASTGTGATISLIQFPAACNVAGICEVALTGKVVGANKVIGWATKFVFRINADTISLIDALGSGTNLYRNPDFSDAGLTYSGGTAGQIRISANAQLLRLVTPGFTDASTTVRWVGSAKITLTREDVVA